jgi:pimeloyl-ACP methyl ester carboxylesterase
MKNKILFNLILAVSLIVTPLMGCSVSATPVATKPVSPTTYTQPTFTSIPSEASVTSTSNANIFNQTLTFGDYQYVMECSGEGSPVTLLLGGRAATWKPIQAEINRSTRTCVFNHIGSSPTPLTAKEVATNVHTLLMDAEITAPFVLVGFSIGGYITRLFADLYPKEVAGMALLDSSHEDQNARFLAALPPESSADCQELKDYRSELQGSHMLPVGPEITLDFDASAKEVREIETDLGNLPLVVLTAGRSDWPPCFPAEVQEQLDKTWLAMQDELASLSENSTRQNATESSHSFSEQPEVVMDAIQQIVQAAKSP